MNHQITIDNIKPDDTLHYPLIILKGRVTDNATCQSQEWIQVALPPRTLTFNLVDCRFKALVELSQGANLIRVTYCCQTASIQVNYRLRKTDYFVIPLYVICDGHDGRFQAPETETNDVESACRRITLCCKLLQSVCAEKLYEDGLGRKTFRLESDCAVFHSKLGCAAVRKMAQEGLWTALGREIVDGHPGNHRKFLGFLSCTWYRGQDYREDETKTHEDFVKLTDGYVALGGGGLALFGTHCLFTWPEDLDQVVARFEDGAVVDKTRFMDDSCYRGTFGGCFSTTLGSVLHELCHTFDLGHTEKGIMGRGFDNIHKVFVPSPERGPIKTHHTNIEFKESFAHKLSEKVRNDKKECRVEAPKSRPEEDDTFWTRSCAVILGYHKWFNDVAPARGNLKFDPNLNLVTSTAGLKVIELRNETDGLVLHHWTFESRIRKYSFRIPEDVVVAANKSTLVVEDACGNVLKQTLTGFP